MRRTELAALTLPLLAELARFVGWLVAARGEADDLVQEVVARALDRSESLHDPTRIRPWLFQLARNLYLDRVRAQATRDRLVMLVGGLDDLAEIEIPAHEPPRRFERHEIEGAVRELPELSRVALLLSDLWGFEQDEIAQVLGVPIGTVKSRVARARARVAARLLSSAPDRSRATGSRP